MVTVGSPEFAVHETASQAQTTARLIRKFLCLGDVVRVLPVLGAGQLTREAATAV
jgi:hypothetical protein